MQAERILIVGGSGTGKTTLAARLGRDLGLPVHELDHAARAGGGAGPKRSPLERDASVADILASRAWIAEGIHLGWTTPLLEAADVVIYLDHVEWPRASARIVKRFVSQAVAEARSRRGRARFLRLSDYGRRLRELASSLVGVSQYHRSVAGTGPATGEPGRAETEALLAAYRHKLVHCRTAADIDGLVTQLRPAVQRRST